MRLFVVHEQEDLSDEGRLLVTNRREWSAQQAWPRHGHGWAIERGYRVAKCVLGFGKYQLRQMAGIEEYWCLVWVADSLLPRCRAVGAPQRAARRFLQTTEALHHVTDRQVLADLIDHIWELFSRHCTPEQVKRSLCAHV